MLLFNTLFAQWTNNPAQNSLLATGTGLYNEIILSTNEQNGSTFIQWLGSYTNGWSPSIQKVDSMGHALWGAEGVHISGQEFESYSNGISMAALTDGGVVSCFTNSSGHCIVVKINDDGTFAWGESGILALETNDCLRTKIVAGHNGGFWVMAHDDHSLHFRHYHSDGTPVSNQITITDENGKDVAFGQMVLDDSDNVFAIYTKEQYDVAAYRFKSIYVVKYSADGIQLSQEEQLMDEVSISQQICHSVCSDGLGGGYAWISHAALNNMFEVYLFHFDSNGHSTISAPTGLVVSHPDGQNFHFIPAASLHPTSHDLLMTFEETDALSQSQNALRINRITTDGSKVWGDNGILIVPMTGEDIASLLMDVYPDGTGASIAYKLNDKTLAALGIDATGNVTWRSTIASPTSNDVIVVCDVASGFHNGQNILAWQGVRNGLLGLYGQNLHQDGSIGPNSGLFVEEIDDVEFSIYQSGNCLYVDGVDVLKIELFNMVGQMMAMSETHAHHLPFSNLPQGIYIVRIVTDNGHLATRKVLLR